ncbi:hypothetical protein TNCT_637171 [Trichonephila clavata]|uniref:Uncharacterized protein n=1 Tax=Trichonephila clavata TaxID=2740835 RepID=A0A8X6LLK2_TRICU|nr:hypothetical protein TNCT_637171 [Trichonephila clavata]
MKLKKKITGQLRILPVHVFEASYSVYSIEIQFVMHISKRRDFSANGGAAIAIHGTTIGRKNLKYHSSVRVVMLGRGNELTHVQKQPVTLQAKPDRKKPCIGQELLLRTFTF